MHTLLDFLAQNSAALTALVVLVLGAPPAVVLTRLGFWVVANTEAIGTALAAAVAHHVTNPAIDRAIGELCLYAEQVLKGAEDPGGAQRYSLLFSEAKKLFPALDNTVLDRKIESCIPHINSLLSVTGHALVTGVPADLKEFTPPPVHLSDEATALLKAIAENTKGSNAPQFVPAMTTPPQQGALTGSATVIIPTQTGSALSLYPPTTPVISVKPVDLGTSGSGSPGYEPTLPPLALPTVTSTITS